MFSSIALFFKGMDSQQDCDLMTFLPFFFFVLLFLCYGKSLIQQFELCKSVYRADMKKDPHIWCVKCFFFFLINFSCKEKANTLTEREGIHFCHIEKVTE